MADSGWKAQNNLQLAMCVTRTPLKYFFLGSLFITDLSHKATQLRLSTMRLMTLNSHGVTTPCETTQPGL